MYRAFQGPNGWYVAFERDDGCHHQPFGGGSMTASEARAEAKASNDRGSDDDDDDWFPPVDDEECQ